jgi:predicted TIM-barrel fold metal-dependent hydrolase
MTAVRQVERAVRDYGFNHIWMMPVLAGLPANHPTWYPIYAKCVELGIPVKVNVGVPGPLRFGLLQQTMNMDEICIAFPELTVVGCHVGHPWHLETVALLQKHANFYLVTSGFAPKHVPKEIYDVVNRRVPHKLMWSSDYPILPVQRCAREGWEVPLKDEVKRRYLRENTIEVFRLDL